MKSPRGGGSFRPVSPTDTRVCEAIKALRRGWALTPLRGKVPILRGWQVSPCPSEAQVATWARLGNVGVRTGNASGLVVVDVDLAKGADVAALNLPATVTSITGNDGLHCYFRHSGGTVPNSVGKLAPHVDIRGDAGQAVFVGSIHPVTGRMYRWAAGLAPGEVGLAVFPQHLLRALLPSPRRHFEDFGDSGERIWIEKRTPASAQIELRRQVRAIQIAPGGTRNDTLNLAAFRLGRLVALGLLREQEVSLRLEWAAEACGLPPKEALSTIRSGLTAGQRELRP
jgi:putative DNA primase/helicase